jgi:GT2 family glycosyltransferase
MHTLELLICSHDRSGLLQNTLDSLNAARRPADWEIGVLIIANACTDGTHDMLAAYQKEAVGQSWIPLRWTAEPIPGKSNALNAAMPLLAADLIAMLDDDHRVNADYLAAICRNAEAHAEADMFCGRILPDWDGSEPGWVHDNGPYRIYPLPVPRYDNGPAAHLIEDAGPLPGGGNLIVRKPWFVKVGQFSTEFGPTGHDLGGAEDLEWVRRAIALGARLYYAPDILQYHYVDHDRLRLSYLLRKAYERSASSIRLRQRADKVPLFSYRKAFGYLAKVVFSASWQRRRFYLIRLSAALGEIKGYRHIARASRALRA